MAADAGIAALAAELPCVTRRWLGRLGNAAVFADYNFFPWKDQNIDTPAGRTPPWTTDDDVHPNP